MQGEPREREEDEDTDLLLQPLPAAVEQIRNLLNLRRADQVIRTEDILVPGSDDEFREVVICGAGGVHRQLEVLKHKPVVEIPLAIFGAPVDVRLVDDLLHALRAAVVKVPADVQVVHASDRVHGDDVPRIPDHNS